MNDVQHGAKGSSDVTRNDQLRQRLGIAHRAKKATRFIVSPAASIDNQASGGEETRGRTGVALIDDSIHDDLINQLAQRGALVLSEAMLNALVLDTLKASAITSRGGDPFPTSHTAVSARVSSSTLDAGNISASFRPTTPPSETAEIVVSPGFSITLTLFPTVDETLSFCDAVLQVPEFSVSLKGRKQAIEFRVKDVPVTCLVIESIDREQALRASGVDRNDLLRIEGIFAYGGVASRLLDEALGEIPDIDLASMFPAIDFGGKLELTETRGHLVVVPERFSLVGNSGCPQGDVLDGVRPLPQWPVQNDQEGRVPLHFDTSGARTFRRARSTFGFAGAYMPKPLLEAKFEKTAPGASHRDHGGGAFKWLVDVSVALKRIKLEIDEQLLALRLTIDLESSGYGEIWVNLPCVGRTTVAILRIELPEVGSPPSSVKVLLRPVVDRGGELRVAASLEGVNLGEVYVRVELFGRWVGGSWKAKVLAFIADYILARVIAWKVPNMVCDELRKSINQHFFVLIDLQRLVRFLPVSPNMPAFSARPQSALLSMTMNNW